MDKKDVGYFLKGEWDSAKQHYDMMHNNLKLCELLIEELINPDYITLIDYCADEFEGISFDVYFNSKPELDEAVKLLEENDIPFYVVKWSSGFNIRLF